MVTLDQDNFDRELIFDIIHFFKYKYISLKVYTKLLFVYRMDSQNKLRVS